MKNLILFSHTYFEDSKLNKALLESIQDMPDTQVRNLNALYPDGKINVEAELAALKNTENIYFQFPCFWFSTPSLLKEWQDCVLTPILYDRDSKILENKHFGIIVTAGGAESRYQEFGGLERLLSPLMASFQKLRVPLLPMHAIYDAHHIENLDSIIADYKKYLM